MICPVPHIAALSAYALADLNAPDGKPLVSLSQNESLRPPSPLAVEAAARAMVDAHLYPDPEWRAFRAALAELHGLSEPSILCGNGSMELIVALTQCFADETCAVLASRHAYPFFGTAARLARARFDTAPEAGGCVCVDHLLNAVRPDTKIVFLANPGNPTGTRILRAEIIRLRHGLPETTLLVIDEAYGEFAEDEDGGCFDLVDRGDTVVLRTMSKAYGLAGQRVGWGVFPPAIAREMRKVMNPNNISIAGQAAALAAVGDQPYMRETCAMTAQLRDPFIDRLRSSGFEVAQSFTNFALIGFGTAQAAQSADLALRSEGIFLRAQTGAGLPQNLRATIGSKRHLDATAEVLERWQEEGGGAG